VKGGAALVRLAVAVAAAVVLTACGDDGPATTPEPTPPTVTAVRPTTPPPPTPATGPSPSTTTAPSLGAAAIRLTTIATLDEPIALAVRSGHDELFVA
jgi:hypothetical protein